MVCGFIQKQHIRTCHQCRCQADSLSIPTGEGLHRALQVADSELLENFAALLLQAPGLFVIHALAELPQLGEKGFIVRMVCDRLTQGAEPHQEVAFGTAALQNVFQHCEARRDAAVLADEHHTQARRAAPRALSQRFAASQHLQQCRFAGSVRSDQSQALTLSDVKIQIGEQGADAEVLGGSHQADQTHGAPLAS